MFKFKKIASVLATTAMLTSTVALAAAATYPEPFVTGGVADVSVVYGSHTAASVDLVGVLKVQDSLNSFITADTTGATTVVGGDSVLLAKSSDKLNLGDAWTTFTGTITDDNLPDLLADGKYTAKDNDEFDYEQKINLGPPTLTHFQEADYEALIGVDEKTPTLGFKITAGTTVINYTLDFTSDAESDIVTAELEDIEGSDLPLLGKTYYVSDFDNGTSVTYLGKLTLLDSASTGIVNEGETITVAVGDTSYDVSISSLTTSQAKLTVNGVLTNSLNEGDTQKLSDGTYIGIRDIFQRDVSGVVGNVEFSLGSGKLEIAQTNTVRLNDALIQGVKGYVHRTSGTSGSEKIDKIIIEWVADEDIYLSKDQELVMPGFGAIKLTMADFVRPEEEKLTLANSGDTSISLTVPIKDGDVEINLLYAEAVAGNFTGIGKSVTEQLATSPNSYLNFTSRNSANAAVDKYFVASYASSSEAESYLLRATGFVQGVDGSKNKTTIEKNVDGAWVETCKDRDDGSACNIGDVSLTIDRVIYTSGGEKSVHITGDSSVNFTTMYTAGGLKIYLPYLATNISTVQGAINYTGNANGPGVAGHDEDAWYLIMDGENKDDTIAGGLEFNLTIDDTGTGSFPLHVYQVNSAGTGGSSGKQVGDSTGVYEAYIVDEVAPRIVHYTKPDEDWAEVFYPTGDSESYAEVYLTDASASLSTGGSATIGAALLDTEISSAAGKSIVVVGGSCVNSVAASLLGSSTPLCGADWETATGVGAGSYLIQTFDRTGGDVATLVAGYNAGDTTNAATALTTQTVDTTPGKKYTGTTAASITSVIA